MTPRRVLFVDDEQNILDGLKRSLRSQRKEWAMEFRNGGKEALSAMEDGHFDIVVTDMKMPEMDGAAFLTEVKSRHPSTIRIILSGHADKAAILRTVGTAHQFLSKPCDAEELKRVINRSLALREILHSDQLEELIGKTENLPSMSGVYQELMTKAEDENAMIKDFAEIIGKDVGMSAKILKLVNSAFFGTAKPVTSIDRAVAYLGLDQLLSLVLSAHIFTSYEGAELPGLSIDGIMNHSLETAKLSKIIAQSENVPGAAVDDAFLGGLLHEVGKLIFVANMPDRYSDVIKKMDEDGLHDYQAEQLVFGTTHGHVGAYLLGLWGLPDSVLEAVAYHEVPSESPSTVFGPLVAVHVANLFAHHPDVDNPCEESQKLDCDYLKSHGFMDRLPIWQAACKQAVLSGVES